MPRRTPRKDYAVNDVEKELLDLEERQWKANREADAEFYRRYCADDFIIVSRFGLLTKAQVLAQFEKGNINPFLRTDMEGPRVLPIGQDSALLTYKETIEASIDAEGGWQDQDVLDLRHHHVPAHRRRLAIRLSPANPAVIRLHGSKTARRPCRSWTRWRRSTASSTCCWLQVITPSLARRLAGSGLATRSVS